MKPLMDGLRALGAGRLVALGAVGLGMLVMIGLLALRGGAPMQMSLLYADLDMREASQIAEALDRAHIAHEEPGQGDRVLVAGSDVARARLLLAKDGLPSGGSIGYEIFDRGDAMTSTQFQQEINETRALEGEIARSIRMLQGVRQARVHLVLPRRQPFSRETQPAQASVVITMSGAARLDSQAVQAVLNLVAAAVPGLKPQGIAVVDSRGTLLARAGQPTGDEQVAQTGEELRHTAELRLSHAVEEMLEQSLGQGRVRAEAAVEMNFDHMSRNGRDLQSGPAGGAQHAIDQRQHHQHRSRKAGKRAEQSTERRRRAARVSPAARKPSRTRPPTTKSARRCAPWCASSRRSRAFRWRSWWMAKPSKPADGKPVWHERVARTTSRASSVWCKAPSASTRSAATRSMSSPCNSPRSRTSSAPPAPAGPVRPRFAENRSSSAWRNPASSPSSC